MGRRAAEKRYQVFISSTFQDLQNARQEVSQALLRADCFPAGMELFPAADEEQFAFIKTIIDQSDYYIIISAGRYGSIHPETGLSYTEMEYNYAVEVGKPIIRLLHKDPFNELTGNLLEETDKGRNSLRSFRNRLSESRLVAFWENKFELGLRVREGLEEAKKRFPADGWVRAGHSEIPGRGDQISSFVKWLENSDESLELVLEYVTLTNTTYFLCSSLGWRVEYKAFIVALLREVARNHNLNTYQFIKHAKVSLVEDWVNFVVLQRAHAAFERKVNIGDRAPSVGRTMRRGPNAKGLFERAYFSGVNYLRSLEHLEGFGLVKIIRLPGDSYREDQERTKARVLVTDLGQSALTVLSTDLRR